MDDKHDKAHQHAGHSSRKLLDAGAILKLIGIKNGDVLLDAGCGNGYFSVAASQIVGNDGHIYAVDIDEPSIKMLEQEARSQGVNNINAVAADIANKMPIGDNKIDIYLMVNVLHGLTANNEAGSSFNEITRVLKASGKLAIVEFKKPESSRGLLGFFNPYRLINNRVLSLIGPPLNIRLNPEEIETIIRPYGFHKVQTETIGRYNYLSVFARKI